MKNVKIIIPPGSLFAALTAVFLSAITLLSCNGCRSGKVNADLSNSDTTAIVKVPLPSSPPVDTDNLLVYVNDSTQRYKDIIFTESNHGAGGYTIQFPNGKTLSDIIDNPIIKDIPKKYIVDWAHIKSTPTDGVIDIQNMDMKTKKRWFSKMDGMRDINKLIQGFYHSGLNTRYMDNGIILKYTFIEVDEEIELNEDDWIEAYVGSVGVIEAYDLKGNKIYEINADKYGGNSICITEDNKYIIIDSQGTDESDRWIFKQGSISIYSSKTGEFYAILSLPDLSSGSECRLNEIYFTSAHNSYDSIILAQVLIHEKKVFTANILKDHHYKVRMDNGIFTLRDGTKYSTQLLSFEEWNDKLSKKLKIK